jgi:septum formation protein
MIQTMSEQAARVDFKLSEKCIQSAPQLIVASASPRRKELFASTGLAFTTQSAEIEERMNPGEPASDAVRRLALEKALSVARMHPQAYVIGADTAVVAMGRVLGKPAGVMDARSMLVLLSGRTHRVLTGVAVVCEQEVIRESWTQCTQVCFRRLRCQTIEAYIACREPLDKAGAYGIQGRAGAFVERIEGSYTNVVGLPMERLRDNLERLFGCAE